MLSTQEAHHAILIMFFNTHYIFSPRSDTCGGRNSTKSEWDEGLACYQCHVHIGNDHVDLVNKANKTSESELLQLSNCDADRGDVTRKYVVAHSESTGHWCISLMLVNVSNL